MAWQPVLAEAYFRPWKQEQPNNNLVSLTKSPSIPTQTCQHGPPCSVNFMEPGSLQSHHPIGEVTLRTQPAPQGRTPTINRL
eukprot:361630-Chlamydomonas_euryale.AAC.2